MALSVHRQTPITSKYPMVSVGKDTSRTTKFDADDGNPCGDQIKGDVIVLMLGEGQASNNHPTPPADHQPAVKFLLDSGAMVHVCNYPPAFSSVAAVPPGRSITAASGHTLPIVASGSVTLPGFRLKDVLFVPGVTENLISVSQLAKLDYCVGFSRSGCFVMDSRNGAVVGRGRLFGRLYEMEFLEIPLDRAPAPDSQ